jgi:broad specificity phosphatase PhoE
VPKDAHHIRDATLTAAGKAQCAKLQATFPLHNVIDLVLSSPLRRAIQTTALSFGPTLARQEIQFVLVPNAQEVSSKTCDIGFPSEILQAEVPKLVEGEEILFDIKKIDYSLVAEGWNSKVRILHSHSTA